MAKIYALIFGKRKPREKLFFINEPIKLATEYKYLGGVGE